MPITELNFLDVKFTNFLNEFLKLNPKFHTSESMNSFELQFSCDLYFLQRKYDTSFPTKYSEFI